MVKRSESSSEQRDSSREQGSNLSGQARNENREQNNRSMTQQQGRNRGMTPMRGQDMFGMSPFGGFRRALDSFFDDWFSPFSLSPFGARELGMRGMGNETLWPKVDVKDERGNVVVRAEVPGLNEQDLDISLEEDRLIIRGEKRDESEQNESDYYYHESSYGSFERVIPLPTEVRAEECNANFKNGILTVTLPKAQENRNRRRIQIGQGEERSMAGRSGQERESSSRQERDQNQQESARARREKVEA